MKPFIRSAFNYDKQLASQSAGTINLLPSRTVQADKSEADINQIVKRYGLTGAQLPQLPAPPLNQDFDTVFDFMDAQNLIREANVAFAALPSSIRNRFNNDPGAYVNFCSEANPDGTLVNLDEMRKMGIAVPKAAPTPPPEPLAVRVVNPEPAPKP